MFITPTKPREETASPQEDVLTFTASELAPWLLQLNQINTALFLHHQRLHDMSYSQMSSKLGWPQTGPKPEPVVHGLPLCGSDSGYLSENPNTNGDLTLVRCNVSPFFVRNETRKLICWFAGKDRRRTAEQSDLAPFQLLQRLNLFHHLVRGESRLLLSDRKRASPLTAAGSAILAAGSFRARSPLRVCTPWRGTPVGAWTPPEHQPSTTRAWPLLVGCPHQHAPANGI